MVEKPITASWPMQCVKAAGVTFALSAIERVIARHAPVRQLVEHVDGIRLETDYGVNIGKFQTLRALATLAYDCRRSDLFKGCGSILLVQWDVNGDLAENIRGTVLTC